MKNKKEYVVPEMETVKINHQAALLGGSCENIGEGCEAGFVFPHEQDPIA